MPSSDPIVDQLLRDWIEDIERQSRSAVLPTREEIAAQIKPEEGSHGVMRWVIEINKVLAHWLRLSS